MRSVRRVLSPFGVLLAFALGAWALRWLTAGSWTAVSSGYVSFDEAMLFVGAVLAWACFAWLALSFLLVALSAVPGAIGRASGALAERVTPALCRRVARVALGVSVAAGPVLGALPAQAATDAATSGTGGYSMTVDRPTSDGVELPSVERPTSDDSTLGRAYPGSSSHLTGGSGPPSVERPESRDPVTRAPTRAAHDVQDEAHVVTRGDTLWDIAKDRLPDDASAADITAEWHRWYDANRDVIGDDPDLILPGQVLRPPSDI